MGRRGRGGSAKVDVDVENDGSTGAIDAEQAQAGHVLSDIRLELERAGEELHGRAVTTPGMWVPGTPALRTSILAIWTDVVSGLLVGDVIAPRVPVTLELDVHLFREPCDVGRTEVVGRVLKAGRSVVVAAVDLTDGDGEPLAVGTASFMPAPDAALTMPGLSESLATAHAPGSVGPGLQVPLAERAGCERVAPGTAVLPRSDGALNASNTVNGGLIALAVEEAVLSAAPGRTLSSLALRYLRPVRLGPAVATAEVLADLGRVEVRDAGGGDRLAAVATARLFGTRSEAVPARHSC